MIARVWKAFATEDGAAAYASHLRDGVLPKLRGVQGFLGLSLGARETGRELELVVTTRWSSMEAVRDFSGPRPDVAVVEPNARAVLKRFSSTVDHYEIVFDV